MPDTILVLVDCPFCGSSRVGFPYRDGRVNQWITCYECGADGPIVRKNTKNSEDKAVLFWNRRKLLQLGE